MVIKRIYKEPSEPAAARVPLGRIRVTIDDLRALLDLLKAHPDVTGDVVVKFDGESEFTKAEDIRELSEASLRDMRVQAGELTVLLSSSFAQAIGPPHLGQFVHNRWARPLRTKRRLVRHGVPPSLWALEGGMFALGLAFTLAFAFNPPAGGDIGAVASYQALTGFVLSLPLFSVFLMVFTAVVLGRSEARRNKVILVPFTMDELRKQQQNKSQVPAWSLVVAILALIASLTFNVIGLINGNPPSA